MDVSREDRGNLTFGENNEESKKRLRELILYIAEKSYDDPKFGAVKLNKLLFYADFISFAKYRRPITNTQYQKLPLGPAPTSMGPVRAEMEAAKELAIVEEGLPPYARHRVVPLREAELNEYFTPRDVALVDEVIQALRDLNASQVSEMSHDFAWQVTENYDLIPYDAVFIYDRDLKDHEIDRAHELAKKYGWDV